MCLCAYMLCDKGRRQWKGVGQVRPVEERLSFYLEGTFPWSQVSRDWGVWVDNEPCRYLRSGEQLVQRPRGRMCRECSLHSRGWCGQSREWRGDRSVEWARALGPCWTWKGLCFHSSLESLQGILNRGMTRPAFWKQDWWVPCWKCAVVGQGQDREPGEGGAVADPRGCSGVRPGCY